MKKRPLGIANVGNSCFFNVIIQILLVLPIERTNIINSTIVETKVLKNFNDIEKIMKESQNDMEIIHPNGLIAALEEVAKTKQKSFFERQEPQDICEFFFFIIEVLHECFKKEIAITIGGKSANSLDNLAIKVYKTIKTHFEKSFSKLLYQFHGIQISRLLSVENSITKSENIEQFFMLDLPILKKNCSIYNCLDEYTKSEILNGENTWYNENTKQYEIVKKKLLFWSFPEILIISLKKTNLSAKTIVDYPLELDLRKYVMAYKKTEFVYYLLGVCLFHGDMNSGHYTCFVKRGSQWYFCNDKSVQNVDNTDYIVSKDAYCLFYVKKNKIV